MHMFWLVFNNRSAADQNLPCEQSMYNVISFNRKCLGRTQSTSRSFGSQVLMAVSRIQASASQFSIYSPMAVNSLLQSAHA